MDKSQDISDTYIPPAEAEMTELIMVRVTHLRKNSIKCYRLYCRNLMLMEKVIK